MRYFRFYLILSLILSPLFYKITFAADFLTGSWKGKLLAQPTELVLWPDRRNHRSTWKEWTAYLYLPSYDCFLIGNASTKGTQSQINMGSLETKGRKNNCRKNIKHDGRFRIHGEIELQKLPRRFVGELSFLFMDKKRTKDNKQIIKMTLERKPISEKMSQFVKSHQHQYFLKPTNSDYAKFFIQQTASIKKPSSNTLALKKNNTQKQKVAITKLKHIIWNGKIIPAAIKNNVSLVKHILKMGGNVNEQNSKGQTALIVAASLNYKEMVAALIAAKAKVNMIDKSGGSALVYAVFTGEADIVKQLIAAKADVTIRYKDNTLLMIAAFIKTKPGHKVVVDSLLQTKIGINDTNKKGMTALMFASSFGNAVMVKQLLEANAKIHLKSGGLTALQKAKTLKKMNVVSVFNAYFKSSKSSNNAAAQFEKGLVYMNQRGRKDYQKAAYWFRKSAKQGFARAEGLLGILYSLGHGVPKDYSKANYWLKKSANKNDPDAQYNYGQMFQFGMGVIQNYTRAKYWYKKAALQEHGGAQNRLASFYELGRGGQVDLPRSSLWYFKAHLNGVRGAKRDRAKVLRRMSPKQIKESTRLLKEDTKRIGLKLKNTKLN